MVTVGSGGDPPETLRAQRERDKRAPLRGRTDAPFLVRLLHSASRRGARATTREDLMGKKTASSKLRLSKETVRSLGVKSHVKTGLPVGGSPTVSCLGICVATIDCIPTEWCDPSRPILA
jgi:hypothetical protein